MPSRAQNGGNQRVQRRRELSSGPPRPLTRLGPRDESGNAHVMADRCPGATCPDV